MEPSDVRSPATPLRPWAFALAAFLAFFAGAVGLYHFEGGDRYWGARLAALGAVPVGSERLVVTIGDSLLEFASLPAPEMADLVAGHLGRGPRATWVALNRDGLNASDVRWLVPIAREREPALIVLQFDPLEIEVGEKKAATWVPFVGTGNAATWFRTWLRVRLARGGDAFEEELRLMGERDCALLPRERMAHWDEVLAARLGRSRVEPYAREPSGIAREVFAAAAGSRLLVVDVPPARPLPPEVQTIMRQRFEALRRMPGVEAVRCPIVPAREETCDGKHYTEAARRRYATWLAGEVAAALRRGERR